MKRIENYLDSKAEVRRYIFKFLTPISHFSKTIMLILAFKCHENKPYQFVS